jgi:hypothetical protein
MIDPARLSYKPGWSFKIAGPLGRYLCVYADTVDSQNRSQRRLTQHQFEMPAGGFADDRQAARWVLDKLLLCEQHETCEFFTVDGDAPFMPHHQDEGSPYELVERWETPCP